MASSEPNGKDSHAILESSLFLQKDILFIYMNRLYKQLLSSGSSNTVILQGLLKATSVENMSLVSNKSKYGQWPMGEKGVMRIEGRSNSIGLIDCKYLGGGGVIQCY